MEYYWFIKRNEILSHVTTSMNHTFKGMSSVSGEPEFETAEPESLPHIYIHNQQIS